MLFINAEDDPVSPFLESVPFTTVEKNHNLLFVSTSTGGHIGWLSGLQIWNNISWIDKGAVLFMQSVLELKDETKHKQ